jgi:hypothetical protein
MFLPPPTEQIPIDDSDCQWLLEHDTESGSFAGELRATWALEADGQPVPASQLRSVAFDEDGHSYVARGAPYVGLWRTTEPLLAPTNVP